MNPGKPHVSAAGAYIEGTLQYINRYWRRSGVPPRERQDRLSELRNHLEEAAAEGRDVRELIGPDVNAFAAGWVQADRSYPWLDALLRFVTVMTFGSGLIALFGPVAFGLDTFGITGESFAFPVVVAFAALAVDIVRMYRSRLRSNSVHLLAIVWVIAAGLVGGLLINGLEGQVAELSAFSTVALLVIGIACAGASRRLRHTSRTTQPPT